MSKVLLTPYGIASVTTQNLNYSPPSWQNLVQLNFSPEGTKLISTTYDNPINKNCSVALFDFDRCTGMFSNTQVIPVVSGSYLWGLSFSPNGKYVYTCSSTTIFQINVDSLTVQAVASWDGFYSGSPPTCCATTFFNMYLAANGKIYITSGNGVQHLHEMNYPDSAGITCDIQQHAINLGVWYFRAVPNHPNYYLGPVVGSICDSLTGIDEHLNEISNFSIRPNPNNGNFSISYQLPQNKAGWFAVYDILGKQIYKIPLPPWSTLQQISLPKVSDGICNAVITSNEYRASKKIAIINE